MQGKTSALRATPAHSSSFNEAPARMQGKTVQVSVLDLRVQRAFNEAPARMQGKTLARQRGAQAGSVLQ